jgi:hypothetical protein
VRRPFATGARVRVRKEPNVKGVVIGSTYVEDSGGWHVRFVTARFADPLEYWDYQLERDR